MLIDLSHVPGLSYVRLDGDTLRVGATTTFTELQSDPLVHEHAFCLERAASQVGSAQIRNVATIGGNIANASPCADGATALVALSADVTTVDGSGRRATRPLRDVLIGSGRTALAHDEVIIEFSFAALGDEHRSAFAKIGWRTAVSVARLSMAIVVRFDPVAEALSEVRIGLGAVGETAFRDAILEGLLEGRPADEESARVLAEGCADAVRRSIPGRYSSALQGARRGGPGLRRLERPADLPALRARLGLTPPASARFRLVRTFCVAETVSGCRMFSRRLDSENIWLNTRAVACRRWKEAMDSLDRDVLLALQADGRKSNLALARSLDLSPSAMLGRVRRLERSGAIRGYRAIIDPAVLGITVRAFVVARLREHSERSIMEFEKGIQNVPGVRACYHVTGQFDMVVELALRDLDHLGQLIRVDIARIPGVMNLETMLIMAEPVAG